MKELLVGPWNSLEYRVTSRWRENVHGSEAEMRGQETSAEVDLLLDKTSRPMMSKTARKHQQSREELANIRAPGAAP